MRASVNLNLARRLDAWGGLLLCALLFIWARLRARLGGPPQPTRLATTPPAPGSPPPAPRRVLCIKFYGLGNIAMLLPVLAALRESAPEVEIDFLTLPENALLLERSGITRRVICVDHRSYSRLLASLGTLLGRLRSARYDVVIDFEQFLKLSTILAYLSGAEQRIGFNTDGQRRGWLYTTRVVYTDSEHMSRIFLRLLRPLRVEEKLPRVDIRTTPEEEARVAELLSREGATPGGPPLVVVHVGSGANFYRIPLKRWPTENFGRLADSLAERHGATVAFTGRGAQEKALVQEALAGMQHPAVDLCDRLSISELIALLKGCGLTVTNDTSVMHLAALVGTPVVAFFGPTAPLHYGPNHPEALVFYKDLYCSPCLTNYNLKLSYCSDPVCIRSISVEEVAEAIGRRFFPGEGARAGPDTTLSVVRDAAARSPGKIA